VPLDRGRLRELILYIAERSEADPRFGATKLNKILYFCDFKAFGLLGRSITGATYIRLDRGPVPSEIVPVLREMEAEGEIAREEHQYFNYLHKRVVPRRTSDIADALLPEERAIVDNVIEELRLNASDVSALSHLEAGWQMAGDREEIPYETVYISDRQPTARELREFSDRASKYNTRRR